MGRPSETRQLPFGFAVEPNGGVSDPGWQTNPKKTPAGPTGFLTVFATFSAFSPHGLGFRGPNVAKPRKLTFNRTVPAFLA
jgi:hypothetical protein